MQTLEDLKKDVFDYVYLRLGGQMVDVELDAEHYDAGLKKAFRVYRQRAANSVEESHAFLELIPEQNEYYLDPNIQQVRQIFRRNMGSAIGAGSANFEPFEAAYMNSYMLRGGGGGDLVTYELYAGQQELRARMFGGFINFTFNPNTKKLTIIRNVRSEGETVLLWVYNHKPDQQLLTEAQIAPWIYDYTLAMCKFMLGEARSKFATIAGPSGGTSLNGDTLKAEAQAEIEKLETELTLYVDGSVPATFIIG